MRGKDKHGDDKKKRIRITPAHAGKSAGFGLFLDVPGDHPRMCGEKSCRDHWRNWHWGSPPHVRGKGVRTLEIVGVTRITPACAGKSAVGLGEKIESMDHPRMCGEKLLAPMAY